ncbi:flagellar hook assembly protein FlgD [Criibacterium bergeronii]|uniref:Flagellar hook capping protein n=1 Tax=Criibacterium bergeronii TaxID=1871336 RepID=A0A371INX8_9FIRM|nr:flagellar hook capping FlgD N-terminal domain-containing protein [Criibacterium bergeronii]MBS6062389.1 hypothetical protein [Peptostreptococcaceae bacterium]RDY22140.1 hypothetical protein BBG48_000005 [Criibacterium bergeronii]
MADKIVPVEVDVSTYEKIRKEREEKIKKEKNNPYGKDTFLKLLTSQMKYQNPLEPMKNEEFMSQMAQLTATEQITNMAKSFEDFKKTFETKDSKGNTTNALLQEMKNLNTTMGKYMGSITPATENLDYLKLMGDFAKAYDKNTKSLLEKIDTLQNEIKKLNGGTTTTTGTTPVNNG